MDEKALKEQLDALKSKLEETLEAKAKKEIETQIKSIQEKLDKVGEIEKSIVEIKEGQLKATEWQVKKDEADKKNQEAIDKLIAENQKEKPKSDKTFVQAFKDEIAEQFESKQADFKALAKDRHAKVSFELKAVGTMTVGANLTGDPVMSYNQAQGLIPNDSINFRN